MAGKSINQFDSVNIYDSNDYFLIWDSETNSTKKVRVSIVQDGLVKSVNSKTGNTITLLTDDISSQGQINKYVTTTEKNKIDLIRTDQGSGKFLSGDGTYREITSGGNLNYTTNTIADRDNLSGLAIGDRVLVLDATGDPTVYLGAALYYYNGAGWTKLAENEGLDITFNVEASNGLTVNNNVVSLGGEITGDTTIKVDSGSTFSITQSGSTLVDGGFYTGSTFTQNIFHNSINDGFKIDVINDSVTTGFLNQSILRTGSTSISDTFIQNTKSIIEGFGGIAYITGTTRLGDFFNYELNTFGEGENRNTLFEIDNGHSLNINQTNSGVTSLLNFDYEHFNVIVRENGTNNSNLRLNQNDWFISTSLGSDSQKIQSNPLSHNGIQISDTITNHGLVYQHDYSQSGSTNPLWIPHLGYITGLTSGGVSSNNFTGITSSAATLTNNIDVAYVENSGSSVSIYLPPTPTSHKRITVKSDGFAYSNPITVFGNGHNIDSDTYAVINSDYGAIEFGFNGSKWLILSFVI